MLRVRYYGHMGEQTGYGRAADELALGLLQIPDVELDLRPINRGRDVAYATGRLLPLASAVDHWVDPDIVLVHTTPFSCAEVLRRERIDPKAVPCVAYTTWEPTGWVEVREMLSGRLGSFRDVWTPWEGMSSAYWMPHGYDPTVLPTPRPIRDALLPDLPGPRNDAKRFYWMGAWNARKFPLGVMRAFAATFDDHDNACLVMHAPSVGDLDWAQALGTLGRSPHWCANHVFRYQRVLTDAEVWAFHASHDCFVCTPRGEAWNLPAFEAAVTGNWVIAPGGQGSDAYLTEGLNASLVRTIGLEPVFYSAAAYVDDDRGDVRVRVTGPQGMSPRLHSWDIPDIQGTSRAMRAWFTDPVRAEPFPERLVESLTSAAVAQRAAARLTSLTSDWSPS